jgi:tetratricopeptide (TPR) repeat protein
MAAQRALAAILAAAVGAAFLLVSGCASLPPRELAQQWYEVGNAWLDKSEWKKAGEAYSKAIALDPSFAGASFNLARALAEAGDYEGSLRALGELEKRDPGNVRIASAKAFALYKEGDAKGALEAYRSILALDPYAADALYNVALLELETGDAAAAAADLGKLALNTPEDADILAALAKACGAAGDSSGELDAYERLKALGKVDAAAYERMGLAYDKARRFNEAMEAFEAAVKADSKRSLSWFSLARLRLVVASDGSRGLAALKSALDSGFSDKAAAAALLDEPDLVERAKVLELLKSKGLAE